MIDTNCTFNVCVLTPGDGRRLSCACRDLCRNLQLQLEERRRDWEMVAVLFP